MKSVFRYQLTIWAILGWLTACEEPPEITRNRNPFPSQGKAVLGPQERLAVDKWSWQGIELKDAPNPNHQNQAVDIFSGVEIDFFYDDQSKPGWGTFQYRHHDGRYYKGRWDLDTVDWFLYLTFTESWDSPMLSGNRLVRFDVYKLTKEVLELRFTDFDPGREAVLVFIHR